MNKSLIPVVKPETVDAYIHRERTSTERNPGVPEMEAMKKLEERQPELASVLVQNAHLICQRLFGNDVDNPDYKSLFVLSAGVPAHLFNMLYTQEDIDATEKLFSE